MPAGRPVAHAGREVVADPGARCKHLLTKERWPYVQVCSDEAPTLFTDMYDDMGNLENTPLCDDHLMLHKEMTKEFAARKLAKDRRSRNVRSTNPRG